ncbi:FAD/NAD(P)-binding protein [Umezawaea sp. Da 62-37]|uniref:FAD/NAD(P)-binding protein n=1 Tax=Umezawaea sp. Da 62-37 TaxID=3075927 RepID=UPI0028F6DA71|nr:FAD/NAD(P)-binding protein [Umezawaea sp. Da 62-37]WNV87805.1 FAD/NAD(P)-binding protein [Umezawaea sp. Da 62-37]
MSSHPSERTAADVREICVVGVGPRGLSVLERLCANADPDGGPVRVHLVDPHLPVGGQVWRTDQPRYLLMNTVASQVTLFVDDTVECAGPVVPGPSLYEWARFVALMDPFPDLPGWVRGEAARLGPDTYPTRAFYGQYLVWVRQHLVRTAHPTVTIVDHEDRAVDLLQDEPDGPQTVVLASGRRITGLDAVVLTLGHLDHLLGERERALDSFARDRGLTYVPPASPSEVDLDGVGPGEVVLLRGLGLNFFDHLALLTAGRGGVFERGPDGRLAYLASGAEPRLVAGSRRGVPHHARGENQKGPFGRHLPLFLTDGRLAALRGRAARGDLPDFRADLWPWIDREVRAVYYAALVAGRSGQAAGERFTADFTRVAGDPAAEEALCAAHGLVERWDWDLVARPYRDVRFTGAEDFRRWLVAYLDADVREARLGNVRGPLKAALDVLRDLRNEIRLAVDHGGLSGDSYREHLQSWYTPLNAYLSIGPPAHRIEEMVALLEAGVLTQVGPGMVVRTPDDGRGFLASSPLVPDSAHRARVLVEARLPDADVRRTTNPLVRRLLATGEGTPYRIANRGGGHYETGGLAVTARPYRVLSDDRCPHPRRFAFGVPTEAVHWATAAGVRPGVNSVILGDADAVARETLALAHRSGTRLPV